MIVARNISLSYEKDKNIIKNASFHIKDKEFIIISGSSGSGKSTLLKAIYANLAVTEGNLTVNSVDITKKEYQKTLDLRKYLGIVFQDYKLIQDYTIAENIAAPLRIREFDEDVIVKQVVNLLKHIRLSHKANAYPDELSGGEQQRVSLARALAHNPSLILADEPTGNLDKYSASIVWKLLQNANEKLAITVVVVTHKLPDDLNVDYRQFNIEEGAMHEAS